MDTITAADKLNCLITDIQTYSGDVSLDLTSGSMASRTAEGFYVTLVNGALYLSDCFKYTGKSEIKVKTLGTRIRDSMAVSLRRIQEITQHFCGFPNVWPLRLSTS